MRIESKLFLHKDACKVLQIHYGPSISVCVSNIKSSQKLEGRYGILPAVRNLMHSDPQHLILRQAGLFPTSMTAFLVDAYKMHTELQQDSGQLQCFSGKFLSRLQLWRMDLSF